VGRLGGEGTRYFTLRLAALCEGKDVASRFQTEAFMRVRTCSEVSIACARFGGEILPEQHPVEAVARLGNLGLLLVDGPFFAVGSG
jgi:hypothetical protein